MIGACVGLAAVKFDLPTDAETLDALFAIPADGANPDLSGERAPGAAGALLNKTWGAVTGGVTTLMEEANDGHADTPLDAPTPGRSTPYAARSCTMCSSELVPVRLPSGGEHG